MSSNNQPTILTLVNGISNGLSNGQSYDLMRRIAEDLDVVFTQVNDTGLPVSGEAIDITLTPESNFPDTVAFTDKLNVFTVDQTVHAIIYGNNIRAMGSGAGLLSEDRVTPGNYSGIYRTGGISRVWSSVFGDVITFNDFGGIGLGGATLITVIGGVTLKNGKSLWGENAATVSLISMIATDGNDLVSLGLSADSTGSGHVSIPRDTAANLPAAGANRNGIIVGDKTNNRFCYYINGARFWLLGTAF
jgi:hypothetical protein